MASPKRGPKNSFAHLVAVNNSQQRPLVPPVLKEVGKLAAGVASVNTASGSATGNPRNKCALAPGHSLMDWIRLGASGKDLTGVGPQAGQVLVTPAQLAEHNSPSDAWLAIRGRVFNVSAYLPFHPGGPDELMRGVGTDATSLFEQVHPWVNYEQILQKCHVGRLVMSESSTPTIEELFKGKNDAGTKREAKDEVHANNDENDGNEESLNKSEEDEHQQHQQQQQQQQQQNLTDSNTLTLPRFDWIQKLDTIVIIFYTAPFSNPFIELQNVNKSTINIHLTYNKQIYCNEITFFKDIRWPAKVKVTLETGKIEIVLRKYTSAIWENYGVLKQTMKMFNATTILNAKIDCIISRKFKLNHNCYLIEMECTNTTRMIVPIGQHIRIFRIQNGTDLWRNYTPIPECVFERFKPEQYNTDKICLLIKRYNDGNLSKFVGDSQIGDTITISRPFGSFDLNALEQRETFIFLAGGTGITPFLAIILFLLERRIKKCHSIRLIFFNKTEKDILLRAHLDELQQFDSRLIVKHVLSQADKNWKGARGHISKMLLEETIQEHLKDTCYKKTDTFLLICGPSGFANSSHKLLQELHFSTDQYHLFLA